MSITAITFCRDVQEEKYNLRKKIDNCENNVLEGAKKCVPELKGNVGNHVCGAKTRRTHTRARANMQSKIPRVLEE